MSIPGGRFIKAWLPPAIIQWNRRRIKHQIMRAAGVEPQDAKLSLPLRSLDELFPGIEKARVTAAAPQFYRPPNMVLPLVELLSIGAICRQAQPARIFEIGTYLGSTTLMMALNSSAETSIWTLDLDDAGQREAGVSFEPGADYKPFAEAAKITQLRGDSRRYDYAPYVGQMDLVFVDANHTYPFVKADTETAFALVKPGGLIIWDDYDWGDYPECVGVARCLNEWSARKAIFQIANTRLAVHLANP